MTPECINAREAVNTASRPRKKRCDVAEDLEARSERQTRKALRRTQEATAEARRRAEEAERMREEAEYLAQFGALPPSEEDDEDALSEGNLPVAVVPESEATGSSTETYDDTLPAVDGGNAPMAEPAPDEEQASDLDAVREELRRRSDEDIN